MYVPYLFIVTVKVLIFPPKSALHVISRQSSVMLQSPGRSIDLHSSFPAKSFAIFSKSSSIFLVAESALKNKRVNGGLAMQDISLGRVVQKPVDVNPEFNVNCALFFSCFKNVFHL